jgi:hypothetical protein
VRPPARLVRLTAVLYALTAWPLARPSGALAVPLAGRAPGYSPGQFTSFRSNDPSMILEGNWQSCREIDGRYSERIYDHVVNGVGRFELHMGPHREFALFKGVQDEHRAHDSPENLLKPYRIGLEAGRAKQRWDVPSLNVALTVTLAGGSRMDCESWFITLQSLEKTSY